MENKNLEVKKINHKIELDTTQEGFFDCSKCYHHQAVSSYVPNNLSICYKFWSDKQNTPFAPA